jgi:radical SAM superfamily enzyme YgiQ (UPF0313 family)
MRYEPPLFRPPSEAHSYILQATIGCSWNNCTYCDMYRTKSFRVRPLAEVIEDVSNAGKALGPRVEKVFVADGDALVMDTDHWVAILQACRRSFPRLRQVSCYAMAGNVMAKTPAQLAELRTHGLDLLYMGPESGDEEVMRHLAKQPRPPGADRGSAYLYDLHVAAAARARQAGMRLSAIFLLGAGGVARSEAHAVGSARLATDLDPDFLAALTLTVVPGTPLDKTRTQRGWELPDTDGLLRELRAFVDGARPRDAVFRTNHASNYLPVAGRLPRDRVAIVAVLDQALRGELDLRPEWSRGL